ncbi:MAG: hypothetical protein VB858_19285, partial [Planctomycetaceae bacterium]
MNGRYTVLLAALVSVAGCSPGPGKKDQAASPAVAAESQETGEQPAAEPSPSPAKPVKQITFGKSKARLVDYAEARK